MRIIAYNRKINAPIRFLYYLEVFDLFVIMALGFFGPFAISSFLPVEIPLWHNLVWLMVLTLTLVLVKIGRAPGFVQHWLTGLFRPTQLHPGRKAVDHFLINERVFRAEVEFAQNPGQPIRPEELREIQESVRRLRQARREAQLMSQAQPILED